MEKLINLEKKQHVRTFRFSDEEYRELRYRAGLISVQKYVLSILFPEKYKLIQEEFRKK